jgi:FkbM family methyltransferase
MGLRSLLPLSMGLRCILFEPNDELKDFTSELCALNDFRDYELCNLCLGDRAGNVQFHVSANPYMSSLDRNWVADQGASREIEVPMLKLDDWIMKRPDLSQRSALIKIDVEGAELRVLNGARQYIERRRPPVICEVASDPNHRRQIWDYCDSMQYEIHSVRNGPSKLAEPIVMSCFVDRTDEFNFLLAPKECNSWLLTKRGSVVGCD